MLPPCSFRHSLWRHIAALLCLLALSGAGSNLTASTCCQTGQLTITSLPSGPGECCYRLEGIAFCGSPLYTSIQIERYYFGSWLTVTPSLSQVQAAIGRYKLEFCVPEGHQIIRLTFLSNTNTTICVRDVVLDCPTSTNCCDDITISSAASSSLDDCCFTISGFVPQSCMSIQSCVFEENINGVWTFAGDDIITDSFDTWVTGTFCRHRANGPFVFRVVMKDVLGNTVCTKQFTYDCNSHTCCQSFVFTATPLPSVPGQCCFRLQGTESSACTFTKQYMVQEFVNGQWQSITGAYQTLANNNFTIDICRPTQTTSTPFTFRVLIAVNGYVYCVKEATYSCPPDCCGGIQITPSNASTPNNCCFNFAMTIPACMPEFYLTVQEMNWGGGWGAPVYSGSIPAGQAAVTIPTLCFQGYTSPTHVRFDFYDTQGALICRRELTLDCFYGPGEPGQLCCDLATVTATSYQQPDNCCFNFDVWIPPCMPMCYILTSEMDWHGVWHTPIQAVVPYPSGTTAHYEHYCLTHDASPARIRFDYYDMNGQLICRREITLDCHYGAGDPPGPTLPLKTGAGSDISAGIVQNLLGTPNPAADEMTLSYTLSEAADVTIDLVDILGRHTALQSSIAQTAGVHRLPIKTSHLPDGVYSIVVKANGTQTMLSIVVMK